MSKAASWVRGGNVTSPKGFLAAAIHAGIKPGREKDMALRSEEHTSELQSRHNISYAVFCLDRKSVV